MIARLIKWSVANRFLVLLATLFTVAWGVWSVKTTPIDALPDLSDVQVIIRTTYPGQAPQIVENQVTYPLATTMLSVPGAKTVRGFSFFGDSFVYVIFEDGTDLYWARSRVLEYLSQVQARLPATAKPALGPDATGVGWIYEYALVDRTGHHDLAQLRALQDWFLKFELKALPNVAEVATVGGMVKQYQVVLDPVKLAGLGITQAEVKDAITKANQESGGSVLTLGEAELMVRASGYLKSLTDFRSIPLKLVNGVPVLLGDVAAIQLGPEMRRGIAELDGQGETVGGVVILRSGKNARETIAAVHAKLEQLKASLPKGVEIVTTYDRSKLIDRAVENLTHKLIEEFIVVALVCALFLWHVRSSLVAIVSLPLGILAAFLVMWAQGIPANIMSLGGIAIAIGAMTDAAIVMIENMHKHMEHDPGADPWIKARVAASEVGPALFFSLLIIAVSFLPVFALGGEEGKLFSPLAFTKTYAMAAAAVLSITLVPLLMAWFIRGHIRPEGKNPLNRLLTWLYRPLIHGVLRAPWLVIVLALVAVASLYFPWKHLGSEFMPPLNEGTLLYMPVSQDPSISIGQSAAILQQTDRIIKTFPEVESVFGKAGRAQTATDPTPISMFMSVVNLKDRSTWPPGMTTAKLIEKMNRALQIPGVSNTWTQPIKGQVDMLTTGLQTPLGIKVTGGDLDTLNRLGQAIQATLQTVPGTQNAYAARATGGRYIVVDTNRLAAARYGLSVADVNRLVETAIGGQILTTAVNGLERFPISLRYPRELRQSLATLMESRVTTPQGTQIPLAQVATLRIEGGPPMLTSDNSRLNSWVYIDLKPGTSIGSYVNAAQSALSKAVRLPPGFTLDWVGQYQSLKQAVQRLKILVPAVIGLIALLLYFNFKNLTEVAIILLTLPLSLVGGFWYVDWLGYKLSVAVGVGFIATAGVAAEFGVVMLLYLDAALERRKIHERLNTWDDLKQTVIEGTLLRLRPMAMTLTMVVGGLLPIMFSEGAGADVMKRIAAPMVGGMLTAALLALLVIPAVYALWQRRRLGLGAGPATRDVLSNANRS